LTSRQQQKTIIRMASASRSALFGKIHKVLKKHYKPSAPPGDRAVLEHLLFACALEDARYEQAEEAFAALKHTFYDWNEVRVTSISELSEVMATLPDPRAAANRIKRVLHAIFEELYCFDLEDKRKKNLGPTVKWLEKLDGTSRFVVAYVIQAALDGHSIPVDAGTMAVFRVLDLVTEKEAATGEVPGMERAIAKSKGAEFGSLVHQLAADYSANPFSQHVREILLAIDPEAAARFPQRRQPRPESPTAPEPPAANIASADSAARKKKGATPTKTPALEPRPIEAKGAEAKNAESKAAGKAEAKKPSASAAKKTPEAPRDISSAVKHVDKNHKTDRPGKPLKAEKPKAGEKSEKRTAEASKTSSAEGLGKRKPR
jgi:endonuclease-3